MKGEGLVILLLILRKGTLRVKYKNTKIIKNKNNGDTVSVQVENQWGSED